MIQFSEYVSLGHPDKIADYISCYLLDRYLEHDPATRYAVEVQIKDNQVTLGGEISSTCHFDYDEIAQYVRAAVDEIGYNDEYVAKWGKECAICGSLLDVKALITQQSPDIAQGLDGWGDQGIFFGYAAYNPQTAYMPDDYALARRLNKALYESGLGGLDIKTQVVVDGIDIRKIIVAIPLLDTPVSAVQDFVRERIGGNYELIVNGTGAYMRHSSIADCGTTGRKLAVDFYGGNCRIGGGCPWTKDGSKADLTLNLYARALALANAVNNRCDIDVALACCIGKTDVDFSVTKRENGQEIGCGVLQLKPQSLIRSYELDKPIYAQMCRWGLFGEYQTERKWEQIKKFIQ